MRIYSIIFYFSQVMPITATRSVINDNDIKATESKKFSQSPYSNIHDGRYKIYNCTNCSNITLDGKAIIATITQDAQALCQIRGPIDVIDNTYTSISNGHVFIEAHEQEKRPLFVDLYIPNIANLDIAKKVKVDIGSIKQKSLSISQSGATQIILDKSNIGSLRISASGSSHTTAYNLTSHITDLKMFGSSCIIMSGHAERLNCLIQGASDVSLRNFAVEYAHLEVNGASSINLYITKHFNVTSYGCNTISYIGSPHITR